MTTESLVETAGSFAFVSPFQEHFFKCHSFDGFGEVVIHTCFPAFLSVALNGGGRHCHYWEGPDAGLARVRTVVTDQMGGSVSIKDGHLDVHENYIWFWMGGCCWL